MTNLSDNQLKDDFFQRFNIIEFLEPSHKSFQEKLYLDTYLKEKYIMDFSVLSEGILIFTDYVFEDKLMLNERSPSITYIYFKVVNSINTIILIPYLKVNSKYPKGPIVIMEFSDSVVTGWRVHESDDIGSLEYSIGGLAMQRFIAYISKLAHILNSSFKIQEHLVEEDKHRLIIYKNRVKYELRLDETTYSKFVTKYL